MKYRQKIRAFLLIFSFLLFPVTLYYFSPALILGGAAENVVSGSFIVFSLMVLYSIIFGRLFCGWACPAGGLQEILFASRNKQVSQKYNWTKWVIWAPWILLIIFISIRSGGVSSIDFFYQTQSGISVAEPMAYVVYFSVILLILLPSMIIGKRSFCHHICWMAPFMIIGSKAGKLLKIPSLRLQGNRKKCTNCMTCSKNCPMSLEVNELVQKEDVQSSECVLCATCIDNCPKKILSYSFR